MCSFIARRYGLPFDVVSLPPGVLGQCDGLCAPDRALRTHSEPDIMCSKMIKFGFFEERWGHEFDKTATGHYATTHGSTVLSISAPRIDAVKDQTDFLAHQLPQLSHPMFPIGDLPKSRVKGNCSDRSCPTHPPRQSGHLLSGQDKLQRLHPPPPWRKAGLGGAISNP